MPSLVGGTVHQWVTTELQDYTVLRKAMDNAFSSSAMLQQQRKSFGDLPGIPIRTETVSPQGKNTTTLISAEKKVLPPDYFQAPADYKAIDTPQP